MSRDADPVACVIGAQVRVYGPVDEESRVRPLRDVIDFPNRGQALLFAHEHDDRFKPVSPQGSAA